VHCFTGYTDIWLAGSAGNRNEKEEKVTLRIAMLDPSAFTIPYDVHLCRALSQSALPMLQKGGA